MELLVQLVHHAGRRAGRWFADRPVPGFPTAIQSLGHGLSGLADGTEPAVSPRLCRGGILVRRHQGGHCADLHRRRRADDRRDDRQRQRRGLLQLASERRGVGPFRALVGGLTAMLLVFLVAGFSFQGTEAVRLAAAASPHRNAGAVQTRRSAACRSRRLGHRADRCPRLLQQAGKPSEDHSEASPLVGASAPAAAAVASSTAVISSAASSRAMARRSASSIWSFALRATW